MYKRQPLMRSSICWAVESRMTGMCEVSLPCLMNWMSDRQSDCSERASQMTMSGCICLSSSIISVLPDGILML